MAIWRPRVVAKALPAQQMRPQSRLQARPAAGASSRYLRSRPPWPARWHLPNGGSGRLASRSEDNASMVSRPNPHSSGSHARRAMPCALPPRLAVALAPSSNTAPDNLFYVRTFILFRQESAMSGSHLQHLTSSSKAEAAISFYRDAFGASEVFRMTDPPMAHWSCRASLRIDDCHAGR